MGVFSPVLDYQVATRFRKEAMKWEIDEEVTQRFLSEFGISKTDLPNGGKIYDAMNA